MKANILKILFSLSEAGMEIIRHAWFNWMLHLPMLGTIVLAASILVVGIVFLRRKIVIRRRRRPVPYATIRLRQKNGREVIIKAMPGEIWVVAQAPVTA